MKKVSISHFSKTAEILEFAKANNWPETTQVRVYSVQPIIDKDGDKLDRLGLIQIIPQSGAGVASFMGGKERPPKIRRCLFDVQPGKWKQGDLLPEFMRIARKLSTVCTHWDRVQLKDGTTPTCMGKPVHYKEVLVDSREPDSGDTQMPFDRNTGGNVEQ